MHDDLSDFTRTTFTHDGETRDVYRIGEGPAVVVMAEMPGITPKVAAFARRVAEQGLSVSMPHLFGEPGRDPMADGKRKGAGYLLSSMVPACISKEFTVLATGKSSPIIDWLRALAREEHERCGGPGVGAIGMCFTGGFALAMAADPVILAPALSQPSLPLGITKKRRANIDITPDDLSIVKDRCAKEGLEVLGMRFTTDPMVKAERFQFLRDQLGDAFVSIEIPGDMANPEANPPPHSVITEHLVDEEGHPTREALDTVLDLFRRKLLTDA